MYIDLYIINKKIYMEQINEASQEEIVNWNELQINQDKLNDYIEGIKSEQNIKNAIIAWFITMLICSIIWATITVLSGYQIGYMSLGLGAAIWFMVSIFGKGIDQIYGVIWWILALIWTLLWNFLSIIWFVSKDDWISILEAINIIDFSYLPQIIMQSFVPMDLIFYWLAMVVWFQLSFRKISEDEILNHASVK
jgi:hypothetical protein